MTYTFKTRPYGHQKKALSMALGRTGFGYLMEMGTGKTKVSIDEMGVEFDAGNIDCAVIIAPKGVYRNWIRELAVHMGCDYFAEYWEPGGGNKTKRASLSELARRGRGSKLRVLCMNVEALSSAGIALKYLRAFIASGRCYMIVDESTTIKGPDSVRTKNVIDVGQRCVRRRIATGSPAPNSPMDLFSQFEFLGPGLLGTTSYYNFRARHAVLVDKVFKTTNPVTKKTRDVKTKVVVRYKNISALTDLVQAHSYRVMKEDCLDLPPKVYRMVDVDLTDEQESVYTQMAESAFAEFEGGFVSSNSAITTLIRLQQIVCGHVKNADGELRRIKSGRVEALMQELEGVSGASIIWSRFRPEIDDIVAELRKNYGSESVAEYHGGNTATRERDAQRFISDDNCRFMVSTQQSGGYGNTWLRGTSSFYMSNSFNLEHRLQSEDRPHRSGQTNKCTYTDMITPGTVDVKLIQSLRQKINIAETILGDSPRDWIGSAGRKKS